MTFYTLSAAKKCPRSAKDVIRGSSPRSQHHKLLSIIRRRRGQWFFRRNPTTNFHAPNGGYKCCRDLSVR
jgi:hypothetical protein